jgi:hypothetical protein
MSNTGFLRIHEKQSMADWDPLPHGGEMSPTRSTCERRSAMILGLAGDVAFAGLIRPSWLQ